MRRDVYSYFQQACHRGRNPASPIRTLSRDDVEAGFDVHIIAPDRIRTVEYRCSTCVTLVALCEHMADLMRGATVDEAQSLSAERLLELHPEIPPVRRVRAHLAVAAAHAALASAWSPNTSS